jgi:hypothetical protein
MGSAIYCYGSACAFRRCLNRFMRPCSKCGEEKPQSAFAKSGLTDSGEQKYRAECKTCCNAWQRAWTKTQPTRPYNQMMRGCVMRWREKNLDKWRDYQKLYQRGWQKRNRARVNATRRKAYARRRVELCAQKRAQYHARRARVVT